MRVRPVTLALLWLQAASLIALAADTTLRELWRSGGYKSKAVPELWRPKNIPPTVRDITAFVGLKLQCVYITNFIAAYGLPDRYLAAKKQKGQDFLLYDLPSGHTAALYVPKPPAEVFGVPIDWT